MGIKIKFTVGFFAIEIHVNLRAIEKQRWADFVGNLRDYCFLSSSMSAEYVGEVFSAFVRLRD